MPHFLILYTSDGPRIYDQRFMRRAFACEAAKDLSRERSLRVSVHAYFGELVASYRGGEVEQPIVEQKG